MPRAHLIVAMIAAWSAVPVAAAEWPAMMPPSWASRGAGGGLALIPAVIWWIVTLAWMRTVDWVSRDAVKHKFTPAFWGMVCGLPMFLAALLVWWLPSFLLGLPLMLVAFGAPVVAYAVFRNAKLPPSERVLTTGHARRIAARLLGRVGIEIDPGFETGDLIPQVVLAAAGGKDAAENTGRLEAAAALPGFVEAGKIMLGAVMARATTLLVDRFDLNTPGVGMTTKGRLGMAGMFAPEGRFEVRLRGLEGLIADAQTGALGPGVDQDTVAGLVFLQGLGKPAPEGPAGTLVYDIEITPDMAMFINGFDVSQMAQ